MALISIEEVMGRARLRLENINFIFLQSAKIGEHKNIEQEMASSSFGK